MASIILLVLNVPNHLLAICKPPCKNDGVCIAPGVCNCTEGWMDTQCDRGTIKCAAACMLIFLPEVKQNSFLPIAICDPPCQNGGHCVSPGNCSCSGRWTGPSCEFESGFLLC